MFYRPEDGHGLPHDPFGAIVAPRPIAWIGTRGRLGDNLAPYSFFMAVAYAPPQVMFASTSAKPDREGTKDSVAQARETGAFSVSLASYAMREAMNATSAPHPAGTDEFVQAGVAKAECVTIDAPHVADSPATLECRVTQVVRLAGAANLAVFGEVTGVHLRDDCMAGGRFDVTAFGSIARLGYRDYARLGPLFEMTRPEGG